MRQPLYRRRMQRVRGGWLSLVTVFSVAVACRSSSDPPSQSQVVSSSPVEDYPAARKRFRTLLVKQGPPPYTAEPSRPPPDAREVTYESNGIQLTAWMSRDIDPTGSPRPAVLYLHGGFGFDLGDWQNTAPFRKAGFVVMAPILRGENGQPGVFSAFYDEIEDVLAAANALAHQPGVDPDHLYVAGHSVGGTLTMLAALATTRFRAAASFSGAPDQRSWIENQREIAPYDPDNNDELRIRSPLAFATSFKCPVRLYWGSEEPFFTQATRETARRAKAAGLDVEAVEVRGDHGTMLTPASDRAIAFFRQHR
jgi:dipeptidyl aminopeptidase/acylaminoacyl peptidase